MTSDGDVCVPGSIVVVRSLTVHIYVVSAAPPRTAQSAGWKAELSTQHISARTRASNEPSTFDEDFTITEKDPTRD